MSPNLSAGVIVTSILMGVLLTGCVDKNDRRLVADEKTCREMGHQEDTPEFKQCMADLNDRRCSSSPKGGHQKTKDCTQILHE